MSKILVALMLTASLFGTACQSMRNSNLPVVSKPASEAFLQFSKDRQAESEAAVATRDAFLAAVAGTKHAARTEAEALSSGEVSISDQASGRTQKVAVFERLSFVMPIALKNAKEYDEGMTHVKALATKLADLRGGAKIEIQMTAADAKANKVKFEKGTAKTPAGNPIVVVKSADKTLAKGMQRLSIEGDPIKETSF